MSVDLQRSLRGYIAAQAHRGRKKRRTQLPVVSNAREAGAGAVTIARRLAKELEERRTIPDAPPWTVCNRSLVEMVLEDHKLPRELRRFMPENARSHLMDAVEQQLGLHPANWTLVHHTTDTIARLANLGHVILVGRGSNLIAAHVKRSLHVRLVAPLKTRIRHLEKFYKMNEKEATDYLRSADRARKRYVKQHFHVSVADPLHYDLVINTGRTGFSRAVQIIADATPTVPVRK